METDWEPGNAEPNTEAVVDDNTVPEEALKATEHEVVKPLLCRVRAMMPDVTTGVGRLLVEVLLAIPGAVLHLGHTETFTVSKSHILSVSVLIVSQSTS